MTEYDAMMKLSDIACSNDEHPHPLRYSYPTTTNNGGDMVIVSNNHYQRLFQPEFMTLVCAGNKKLAQKLMHGVVDIIWERKRNTAAPTPAKWVLEQVMRKENHV